MQTERQCICLRLSRYEKKPYPPDSRSPTATGRLSVFLLPALLVLGMMSSAGCQIVPNPAETNGSPVAASSKTAMEDVTATSASNPEGSVTSTPALTDKPMVSAESDQETAKDMIPEETLSDQQLFEQVRQMRLTDKVGQLILAGFYSNTEAKQLVRDLSPGGLILFSRNIQTEEQTRRDIDRFQAAVPEGLPPLFIAVDQEGGRVSRLPDSAGVFESAQEIGQRADVAYARTAGEKTGLILNAWGFNVNCAPVLDIGGNPDNTVIGTRSYGQTAAEVSLYGLAVMHGLQDSGILAVVKHFPGHGGTATDSHLALPVSDQTLAELKDKALIPFADAVAGGAEMVMMAHIRFSGLDERPASLSPVLVDGLLRSDLGFTGVVLTDDLTMKAITDHYSIGEAAVMAIEAGCDLVLVCHDVANVYLVRDALLAAVRTGRLSETRIDTSVKRILQAKRRLP